MKQPLRIAVVCGGQSSEHEVSLATGRMIQKNLNRRKYRPVLVTINKKGEWQFGGGGETIWIGDAVKKLKRFDFVFIAFHGAFGEDGRFQALLEWIGIPYSGSGILSSVMAIDKEISNKLYETSGLRVPRYVVIKSQNKRFDIKIPFVVKPADGGSSVGISIVKSKKICRLQS